MTLPKAELERLEGLLERFESAVSEQPSIAARVSLGQQFNAYESAENDENDDDADLYFYIGIGPITNCLSFMETHGRAKAEMIEAALKIPPLLPTLIADNRALSAEVERMREALLLAHGALSGLNGDWPGDDGAVVKGAIESVNKAVLAALSPNTGKDGG